MHPVPARSTGGARIAEISRHAARRYRERCAKEHYTLGQAAGELLTMALQAPFVTETPEWVSTPRRADTVGFVVIVDSIALPVTESGTVTTVLVRGSADEATLAYRRRERRRRRRRRGRAVSPPGPDRGRRPEVPDGPWVQYGP